MNDSSLGPRPLCSVCGVRHVRKNGKGTAWGNKCQRCHVDEIAQRRGMDRNQYLEAIHPEKQHKKDYCENQDGHLGFACTFPTLFARINGNSILELDHQDGDPSNGSVSNFKTYCPTCHKVKTYMNGDHLTEGRRTLKMRS